MIPESKKQKTTNRQTYEKLDDFRIILGHAGIPHDLYRSPKGRLFIRFDRPIEGDSVVLQFRKERMDVSGRTVRDEHFLMFIGVLDQKTRQQARSFPGIEELVEFLGIPRTTILAGQQARAHLKRRLQASSVDEQPEVCRQEAGGPAFLKKPAAVAIGR